MTGEPNILAQIEVLKRAVKTLEVYSDKKNELKDRHGVVDAQNDLRELEAAIRALQWVLYGGDLTF